MALAIVQQANVSVAATSGTITPASATTAGNLLVVLIGTSGTAPTVTDSARQTWTQAIASGSVGKIFYRADSASVTSVTVHTGTTTDAIDAFLFEISGALTVSPLDVTAEAGATSTAWAATAAGATAQANEIVIGGAAIASANTLALSTAGFTLATGAPLQQGGTTKGSALAAWQIVSAIETPTIAGTVSKSAAWHSLLATFKAAAAPAVIAPTRPQVVGQAVVRASVW